MARITIPIYFDYASTLCYVAWRIVRELERELEFEPLWKGVPIRLRNRGCTPGNALGAIERVKIANQFVENCLKPARPLYESQHLPEADAVRERGRCQAVKVRLALLQAHMEALSREHAHAA